MVGCLQGDSLPVRGTVCRVGGYHCWRIRRMCPLFVRSGTDSNARRHTVALSDSIVLTSSMTCCDVFVADPMLPLRIIGSNVSLWYLVGDVVVQVDGIDQLGDLVGCSSRRCGRPNRLVRRWLILPGKWNGLSRGEDRRRGRCWSQCWYF